MVMLEVATHHLDGKYGRQTHFIIRESMSFGPTLVQLR